MKTVSLITISSWLAALSVFAIEAPPDDAPPPVEVAPQAGAPAAVEEPLAKPAMAYLGVVTSTVPELLAEHLQLKPGEGIVVGAVMPDSPAAKAGLAVNDIITRVGDKPVGTSEELTARITSRRPGDTVRLDVIHQGKAGELDVMLGDRPPQFAMHAPQAPGQLKLDGIPDDLADRVRRMIEGNLGELKLDFEKGIDDAAPQIEDAMRQMRERMGKAMEEMKIPDFRPQGGIEIHPGATFRLMDEQGSIELKSNEGGKEITVRDKDENITWTGPWDTDQDKAAAPEDVRRRVDRLDMNGLNLRFRNVPAPGE